MRDRMTPREKEQVYLGLGVSLTCMVVSSGLVLALLFIRNKLLLWRKDRHPGGHTSSRSRSYTNSFGYSGSYDQQSLDMTRSMAFNRRSFHTIPNGTPATSLMDGIYEPPLRPLHTYHDPFAHRSRIRHDRLQEMTAPPRAGFPSEPGGIAVVPFRESNLPIGDAFYTHDGRVNPHRENPRTGRRTGRIDSRDLRRSGRLFRHSRAEERSSQGTMTVYYGEPQRHPREWRHSSRDVVLEWQQNQYSDRYPPEDDEVPVALAPRRGQDVHAPIHGIAFPWDDSHISDSSHLEDVYY